MAHAALGELKPAEEFLRQAEARIEAGGWYTGSWSNHVEIGILREEAGMLVRELQKAQAEKP
jgi:hypothetical protein